MTSTSSIPLLCSAMPSLFFLLLLLLLSLHLSSSAQLNASSPSSPNVTQCVPWSCGAMPMSLLRCADGSVAGYRCERIGDGPCHLAQPQCPPSSFHPPDGQTLIPLPLPGLDSTTGDHVDSLSPSSITSLVASSSPQAPIFNCTHFQCGAAVTLRLLSCGNGRSAHPICSWIISRQHCGYLDASCDFLDPINNIPSAPSLPSSPSASPSPTRSPPHPIFNCSKAQCGPSITAYILTCPDGRSAHPLCSWLSDQQRCGYLDASCAFPDPAVSSAEVCGRGSCILPQYVKMCLGGGNVTSVAPTCQWVEKVGRCLAVTPKCPEEAGEVTEMAEDGAVKPNNGASIVVMRWGLWVALLYATMWA